MKVMMVGGPHDGRLFDLADGHVRGVVYADPAPESDVYTLKRYGAEQFLFHSSVYRWITEDELDALTMRSWRVRNADWVEANPHTVYGSGGRRELQELLDDGWVWIGVLKDGD